MENAQTLESRYGKGKFPIYYDETKEVPKELHQEWKLLKLGRMPALLILDKDGIVQYAYYSDSMKDIPENEKIFEILEKLPH